MKDPGSTTHLSSPLPSAAVHVPVRRPVLIAMFGPNPGTVYPIEGETVIGRDEKAEITIRDERVSRRHTRIVVLGPDLAARLASDTVTVVDPLAVPTAPDGSRLPAVAPLIGTWLPTRPATRPRRPVRRRRRPLL